MRFGRRRAGKAGVGRGRSAEVCVLRGLFGAAKAGLVLGLTGPVLVTQGARKAVAAIGPLAGELATGAAGTLRQAPGAASRSTGGSARGGGHATGAPPAGWR